MGDAKYKGQQYKRWPKLHENTAMNDPNLDPHNKIMIQNKIMKMLSIDWLK